MLYREATGDIYDIERTPGIPEARVLSPENTDPSSIIVMFSAVFALANLAGGVGYELSKRTATESAPPLDLTS